MSDSHEKPKEIRKKLTTLSPWDLEGLTLEEATEKLDYIKIKFPGYERYMLDWQGQEDSYFEIYGIRQETATEAVKRLKDEKFTKKEQLNRQAAEAERLLEEIKKNNTAEGVEIFRRLERIVTGIEK